MAAKNELQLRLTIYGVILSVLLVCAVVFYQFLRAAERDAQTLEEATNGIKKVDYPDLDLSVIESQKFKDLEEIDIPPSVATGTVNFDPDKGPVASSTQELTPEELARLPRKKSNPFIPSF